MRNLKPYKDDSFEFWEDVVKRKQNPKHDPTFKSRVTALNNKIKKQYLNFDTHFGKNNLEELSSLGYSGSTKDDLLNIYSYKSKLIQELKKKVTVTAKNRIINTCQNCTINEINSFDHFVPQSEFSEFVVNPRNLFPSCTQCNGYKSLIWRDNGKRTFLNLYLDNLPKAQYLFVDITLKGKSIDVEFHLENPNKIDKELFNLIKSHYTRLHLCERFNESIDQIITPLINSMKPYISKLPIDEIKDSVIQTSEKNKIAFGHNYWKSILEIELVNFNSFTNKFVLK